MTIKIAHLVYSFGFGGLEQVIVNLINNSEAYDAEHIIITLTDEHGLVPMLEKPATIRCLHKKAGNDFSSHIRLFRVLRELNPDVLQTYNFATIEYHPIAWLAGVKRRIHCDHGRGGDDPNGRNIKNNVVRKLVSGLIHEYLVVSHDLYDWALKVLRIRKSKLKLVYNGVDLERYNYTHTRRSDRFIICTIGRLHEVKNHKMLIEAFCELKSKYPDVKSVKLVVVGDGPLYSKLMQQVTKSPYASDIELAGYRSDIPNILQSSHLFALTSHYEAMPMTILESLACGTPVISTDVGGIRRFISDSEIWLVEDSTPTVFAEKIYKIMKSPEIANDKSLNGYSLVKKKYSMSSMVKSYMNLYLANK